jgi:hypothetical protein
VVERIPNYAFPFVLISLELTIRYGLGVDSSQFIGPALASAAAGVCVPHLAAHEVTSTLPEDVQQVLREKGVEVVRANATRYASQLQLLLLVSLAIWCAAVVLAEKSDLVRWFGLSRPAWLALGVYLLAVVVVERKEAA